MRISYALIVSTCVCSSFAGSLAVAAPIATFQQIANTNTGNNLDNTSATNSNNYTTVPPLTGSDFLNGATATANANGATFTSANVSGGGTIGVLTDGVGPGRDDPTRDFFGGSNPYTMIIDLGSILPVYQINTYSRHHSNRAPQELGLDASNSPTFAAGTVTTLVPSAVYGISADTQVGVSFHDGSQTSPTGAPGTTPLSSAFRYYRLTVNNNITFYGEVDVVAAVPEPASLGLLGIGALGLLGRRVRSR